MSDVLRFEVECRPLGVNNLYANGRPTRTVKGKTYVPRVSKTSTKDYKELILRAALAAAHEQGWELGYCGTASITIIDYRKGVQGCDWDGIPKGIQDALQPQKRDARMKPLGDDREIWDGRVLIANSDRPRVVVIVRKTTREAIAAEAARVDSFSPITPLVVDWASVEAEARRRSALVPSRPVDVVRSGNVESISFAERDRILAEHGIGKKRGAKR